MHMVAFEEKHCRTCVASRRSSTLLVLGIGKIEKTRIPCLLLVERENGSCHLVFLILEIYLACKFLILDIQRKQNIFNIDLVLVTLINWLLKPKMYAKTYFLEFYCMKIQCYFVFYL